MQKKRFSEGTYYRWKAKYGGLGISEALLVAAERPVRISNVHQVFEHL